MAEILTIAGVILGVLTLVLGGPVTGLLIKRRQEKQARAAAEKAKRAQKAPEFPELHEAKLTPLERAELRVDAAWATYTNEHQLYVKAYADQYVGEEVSA